ncbi:MAG: 50S ribosomal protein L18 [Dehalococcoidia bacterium]|nr:50S ribosomal protein L18 [Dehalococcoidia bacterium]
MARRVRRLRRRCAAHQTRPRLCVFRSPKHIYAQVIDDAESHTLAAASSLAPDTKAEGPGKTKAAALVGSLVAQRAIDKGVTKVVFDRHGYKYHGRVKALAEGARETGLEF